MPHLTHPKSSKINQILKLSLSFFILSLSSPLLAKSHTKLTIKQQQRIHKYWPYFRDAAKRYKIDYRYLIAIGLHESSCRATAINKKNRNKSIDVGVMQVNSWWFPKLKKYTKDLNNLYDPRFNIHVGAWIFKQCTNQFGVTRKAIDCYNKGAPRAKSNSVYVRGVEAQFRKIKNINLDKIREM